MDTNMRHFLEIWMEDIVSRFDFDCVIKVISLICPSESSS
jgi:hypothetical protein